MQIDISFDTWKALTAQLIDEEDSYDAAIGRLLGRKVYHPGKPVREMGAADRSASGAVFKGVFLPDGTELRATYKGKTYFAHISGSEWIDDETGDSRTSPSQAAYCITESGVNGWLFWMVKRPEDAEWQSLNSLRI